MGQLAVARCTSARRGRAVASPSAMPRRCCAAPFGRAGSDTAIATHLDDLHRGILTRAQVRNVAISCSIVSARSNNWASLSGPASLILASVWGSTSNCLSASAKAATSSAADDDAFDIVGDDLRDSGYRCRDGWQARAKGLEQNRWQGVLISVCADSTWSGEQLSLTEPVRHLRSGGAGQQMSPGR